MIPPIPRWTTPWRAGFMRLRTDDLNHKHTRMQGGPSTFLRATFFRCAAGWR